MSLGDVPWKRLAVIAGVGLAALFVIQGGEYGTWDLLQQRSRKAELQAALDTLERELDSLRREKQAIETDPTRQERIARERFGMVRGPKEILYRFTDTPPARSADEDGEPKP